MPFFPIASDLLSLGIAYVEILTGNIGAKIYRVPILMSVLIMYQLS